VSVARSYPQQHHIRCDDETKAKADAVADAYDLGTKSAAFRFAVARVYQELDSTDADDPES
jgi:antitoxin component of RelBE/YafQ-DinJ toxin-antitoxin module